MKISHTPRIVGGRSLHAYYDPRKCHRENPAVNGPCGFMRVVDCCNQAEERDVSECSKCGFQQEHRCTFDEDMA
jgi:hypothetical protein